MILSIEHLDVTYKLRGGLLRAVQNVSLDVEREGSLGIVGESGCGKSTLAFAILRILPPNAEISNGGIVFDGKDITKLSEEDIRRIRWSRISMVFQSAMNALDPVMKIKDQLAEPLNLHSQLSKNEMKEKISEVFELVGLPPDRLTSYPHELSGGMRQRVLIAMSLICNPKVLIADEPTTALDVVVQRQILRQIRTLQKKLGFALIMISHDLACISETCQEIAVMYGGRILEQGKTEDIVNNPRHPYTVALLNSFPNLRGPMMPLSSIPGVPPDLSRQISGCIFRERCRFARDICMTIPPSVTVSIGHFYRCHFAA